MRRASIFCLTVFLGTTAAFGQTTAPDSPVTQTLLSEIRQLRQDLQTTAATIQRVQIVMYRLQTTASLLYRATERLDNARARCNQAQAQRKMVTTQIEQRPRADSEAHRIRPIGRRLKKYSMGLTPPLKCWPARSSNAR